MSNHHLLNSTDILIVSYQSGFIINHTSFFFNSMVGISPTDPFVVLINSSRDVISDHLLPFSVKKKKKRVKT